MKVFLLFIVLCFHHDASGVSLDDKPPEHTKQFYLDKSIPQIKDIMEADIAYISPLMQEARDQYHDHGLVVPAQFLDDVRALVRRDWSEVLCQLDAVSSESEKIHFASFAVEVYGMRHMVDRIKEEREVKPLLPTDEHELDLYSQMMDRERNTTTNLDFVINRSKTDGNVFLEKFHALLKQWIVPEFTKLNEQIKAMPSGQQRTNNIKVLNEDLWLIQQPPF